MPKYCLIGSTSSLDDLIKLIKLKWYWSIVELNQIGLNEFSVFSGKGLIPNLRVIKIKNRFRLERIEHGLKLD